MSTRRAQRPQQRRHKKDEHRPDRLDEPALPDEERYDDGHDAIWVVGTTDAGFPYGPTRSEMRRALEHEFAGAPWARAKAILRAALTRSAPGSTIEIGRVVRIGQGLSRLGFAADVGVSPDPADLSGPYVVALPARGADESLDQRTEREARLLEQLGALRPPFRVPRVLGVWPDGGRLALVRGFLQGIELDLRAGRQASVRPWDVIGELAAAVHSLPTGSLSQLVPGHSTTRGHAEAFSLSLEDLDVAEARAALAWIREHLPPAEPSVLVHGDLLGQNVLLAPGQPPGLVDWEYARLGDPAYDLAITTRGARRPFQVDRGLARLLDAYLRFGGRPVEAAHVHAHELIMVAGWYRDSLMSRAGDPPEQALARLRSLLRRVGA